ncbi:MAG: type II toxin-antitoxin system RelE/ParE family toxin [Acidobacteriota bacterium]|nr:type II toxin-antitoxin system RelE/ParE family toxin [Acidobacteriota bacterium]
MPREVVFRPQAEDDALAVHAWYESRRAGLGREFGQAVEALISRIVENPFSFQRVHVETRRAVLSRLPYAIYFRASDAEVVVLAIHGRQHQSRWQERSKLTLPVTRSTQRFRLVAESAAGEGPWVVAATEHHVPAAR